MAALELMAGRVVCSRLTGSGHLGFLYGTSTIEATRGGRAHTIDREMFEADFDLEKNTNEADSKDFRGFVDADVRIELHGICSDDVFERNIG